MSVRLHNPMKKPAAKLVFLSFQPEFYGEFVKLELGTNFTNHPLTFNCYCLHIRSSTIPFFYFPYFFYFLSSPSIRPLPAHEREGIQRKSCRLHPQRQFVPLEARVANQVIHTRTAHQHPPIFRQVEAAPLLA